MLVRTSGQVSRAPDPGSLSGPVVILCSTTGCGMPALATSDMCHSCNAFDKMLIEDERARGTGTAR